MIGLTYRHWPLQLLVGLTGVFLGYIEYLILKPAPLIPELDLGQVWIPALILLIFTGFLEELIFRGMMQYASLRSLGRIGIYFVAVVFAVLHLGYHSAVDVLFVLLVALFFGWVTFRTGSILGVSLAHGLTNIGLYLILPFILVTPAAAPGVPVPTPVAPQPGLLAPLPTFQSTRPWLPPTATPIPPASPTVTACQLPQGWVIYTVQVTDTLASLSLQMNMSPNELQAANCLITDTLAGGQTLYIPYMPTPTATASSTPTRTARPTRTKAPAGAPATNVPTPVPSRTWRPPNTSVPPSNTAVPPTRTPVPPTHTPLPPTATSVPPTNTLEPSPTNPPPLEPTPTSPPLEPTPTDAAP
jgi:LysM repeat protein